MKKNFLLLVLVCVLAARLHAASLEPVVTEGLVNASIDAVWKAFTEKSVIEKWMVAKTEIELKVGATWKTSYNKDSDLNDDTSIHQTILAYDPGRMLAFRTIKIPKGFPYPAVMNTWTVVYFESAGADKTRVTIRMMGLEDNEQGRQMRAFFEPGNKSQFDALAKFFQAGATQTGR